MKNGSFTGNTRRTFIAVKVPPKKELTDMLLYLQDELKDEKIRWINPDNLHITLRFLGDTDELIIDQVSKDLKKAVTGSREFNLVLQGAGVFRSISYPRVLWFGLQDTDPLISLKKKIDEKLSFVDNDQQYKSFTPHLTIGRMKRIIDRKKLSILISELSNKFITQIEVKEFIYYESILRSDGAVYKPISVHKLR